MGTGVVIIFGLLLVVFGVSGVAVMFSGHARRVFSQMSDEELKDLYGDVLEGRKKMDVVACGRLIDEIKRRGLSMKNSQS